MVDMISSIMHQKLLQFLRNNGQKLSIILDTTTDRRQYQFLIIYLRTTLKNYPITLFYKMIELENETANYMKEKLIESFRKDNIEDLLHNSLVGTGTDGASAMMGREGGLVTLLKNHFEKGESFYAIHCLAHKLNLSVVHGLRANIQLLEEKITDCMTFVRYAKRKGAFKRMAELNNEKFIELKQIFEVRWSAAELETFKSFLRNYMSLFDVFLHISSDTVNFDQNTRQKAVTLATTLSHSAFIINISFACDLLEVIAHASERYQLRSAVLIGQEDITNNLIDELEALKLTEGVHLQNVLGKLNCAVGERMLTPCHKKYLLTNESNSADVNRLFLQGQNRNIDFVFSPGGNG